MRTSRTAAHVDGETPRRQQSMNLTSRNVGLLEVLLDDYGESDYPVSGAELAERTDQHRANVSQQMGTLKALGLVEAVPGAKGGYSPTAKAYKELDDQRLDTDASLTVTREHGRVETVVERVRFTDVSRPDRCTAVVHVREQTARLDVGDPVIVGPTPCVRLAVTGVVSAVDDDGDGTELRVDVSRLEAPLD